MPEAEYNRCVRCNEEQPADLFWRAPANRSGLSSWCKPCTKKNRNEWRAKYPERDKLSARRAYVKKKFGLKLEEYDALIASGCAICGTHDRQMHLDHNHDTGAIREALCGPCNQAIGLLAENTERLHAALAYLEKHS